MDKIENKIITRVFDVLECQLEKFAQKKALNKFTNGKWKSLSIQETIVRVDALSCKLLDSGYKSGDKIAIVPTIGRPEWMILDFACQQIGVVLVTLHPSSSESEMEYILKESEACLCLTADSGLYYKVQLIAKNLNENPDVKHLESQSPGYFEALKPFKPDKQSLEKLKVIKDNIKANDLFAILYTSGTSGEPKGVMLSHSNVVSNILSILPVFPLKSGQRVLSFLPFSHILERTACYSYICLGVSVFFSSSMENIAYDFKTVRPHFCTVVPRILEKMHDFIQEQVMSRNFLKKLVFRFAIKIAKEYNDQSEGFSFYMFKLFIVRILVLNWWRYKLGGKINSMAVGAASLRPEIGRMFSAAKIKIREGYGMTETSPLVTINRFENGLNRFGTVGIPINGVQVKIDSTSANEEGEILVKGDNVMKAYYKRPDLTTLAFTDDGWLKTGDVGIFVDQKFLKITDRKKDIFKTSGGKYVAPQPLENHFLSSPYIEQCLIMGFNRPFVSALIVPQFSILQKWCIQEAIHWTSPQYMIHNIKVKAKIQSEVDLLNEQLENYQRVKGFVICPEEWSSATGEMTSSYKPLRNILYLKYSKDIEKMYL